MHSPKIISLLVLTLTGCWLAACTSQPPATAMPAMQACPSSPNCVSSQAQGDAFIEAFTLIMPAQQAWPEIIITLQSMPRTKIILETPDYIHATATSLVFRFVDDLELQLVSDGKTIDVRSASRVGYSDMGVNRRRLEELRKRLQEQQIIQ